MQRSPSAAPQHISPALKPKPRPRLAHYPTRFQVVSLRGSAVDPFAEGNSLEVLKTALQQGVDFVEVDFRMAADGVLVSSHDREIYGCGMVATLPSADACACQLSGGRHLATLRELLELPFAGVYLDLKDTSETDDRHVTKVVTVAAEAIVKAQRQSDTVMLLYRAPQAALQMIRRHGLRAGMKGYPDSVAAAERLVRRAAQAKLELLCMNSQFVTVELVKRSARLGVWHLPWSTRPEQVERWKQLATAGIGGMVVLHYRLVRDQVAPRWSPFPQSPASL